MITRTLLGAAADGTLIVQDESGQKQYVDRASVPAEAVNAFARSGGAPVVYSVDLNGSSNVINLFQNNIPTPNTFDSLTVPFSGAQDIIYHSFYDSAALTSAAANEGSMFLNPQQQIYNGNLSGNGTLTNNERFFMTGIRFELENNDTTNPLDVVDVAQSFRLGTYSFLVGSSKAYSLGKLIEFVDELTNVTLNTNYYSVRPFKTNQLPLPIAIGKLMQFQTQWKLTATTLGSTTRLFNYIKGFWYRNVQ